MDERTRQKHAVAKLVSAMARTDAQYIPIRKHQEIEAEDRGVPGNVWVSKVCWEVDAGPNLRKAVKDTWKHLDYDNAQYFPFDYNPTLDAEWIGARKGHKPDDPSPSVPPHDSYTNLANSAANSLTLLYIHGGAFVMGSAARSRPMPAALTASTNACAFSIDYRLAPQHTLPACILDAVVAYFYLISPPPGSFHAPIPAHSLVIAAESSGGTIAAALVQCLLHLRRQNSANPTVLFNGRRVPVDLPAGVALVSPCFDWGPFLPSYLRHADTDWLWGSEPFLRPNFPADDVWPSDPPRAWPWAHDTALAHPMLNAAATAIEDMRGFPPLWLACGEECLSDGVRVFGQHVVKAGGKVQVRVYEGMPHIFPLVLPGLPQARDCVAKWVWACGDMGAKQKKERWESKAVFVELGELHEKALDVRTWIDMDLHEVRKRIFMAKIKLWGLVWTGPKAGMEFTPMVDWRSKL